MKRCGGFRLAARDSTHPTRAGFTLVELLVVIAIIVILIGAVVMVGGSQVEKAKVRETSALLNTLHMAAGQFADEKPLGKVHRYTTRYGYYPPDELDGFVEDIGIPRPPQDKKIIRISPGGKKCFVKLPDDDEIEGVHYGDIKAFALAIRCYSEAAAATIDRIQPKHRHAADPADPGNPAVPGEYLNRDGDDAFTTDEDEPLDYFVDAWGTPVAYFATAEMKGDVSSLRSVWDSDTDNNVQAEGDRLRTCRALLSLSNHVPVFVSYGPDGPEQFSADFREAGVGEGFPPDLIYDFGQPDPKYTFDHPMNQDNVYSNETVQKKIMHMSLVEGVR
ncbi:MAG: prepilin-type N-terminal cleavage/methylation domain-containing protein [Phycisphaerae bacterium]|nr:prepilin-type N-terminal cleavage/methylation domain-containing protein [Phycisphaerae bacterium]